MTLFAQHMAMLRSLAPDIARWLKDASRDSGLALTSSLDGRPDVVICSSDGRKNLLYGQPDPLAYERAKLRDVPLEEKKIIVLCGLGLGYGLEALAERLSPDAVVFVLEENPALAALALDRIDITRYLASGRLFFIEPNEEKMEKLAGTIGWRYGPGQFDILVDPFCQRFFSHEFKSLIKAFVRRVREKALQAKAFTETAATAVRNELANLPLTLSSPDVGGLRDIWAGRPVVIVSAGPSLNDSLPDLRQARDGVGLIAVGPVLRTLLAHDLKPDLAAVLDYGQSENDIFRDIGESPDVPLVFLDQTEPSLAGSFHGPLLSMVQTQAPVRLWLGHLFRNRRHWTVGGNVGLFCLDLAIHLGGNPIILVGQDLAYPDGMSHGEGVVNRLALRESFSSASYVQLESVGGGQVRSNVTLAGFLAEFEKKIGATTRTIINTSPCGARIHGTVEMPLAEALKQFGRSGSSPRRRLDEAASRPSDDLPAVMAEIERSAGEFSALKTVAETAAELNRRITSLLDDPHGNHPGRLPELLHAHTRFNSRVEQYCQTFELLRFHLTESDSLADPSLADRNREPDRIKALRLFMDKNRSRLQSILKAIEELRELVDEAGRRISALYSAETGLSSQPDSASAHLNAARACKAAGSFRLAVSHYRAAAALDPENADLLSESAGFCLEHGCPEKAAELLRVFKSDPAATPEESLLLENKIAAEAESLLVRAKNSLNDRDWISALLIARRVLRIDEGNQAAADIEAKALQMRAERLEEASRRSGLEDASEHLPGRDCGPGTADSGVHQP